MAKYRSLSEEELKEFEKEFVDYLVVNGIAADDWEKMKLEENEKAQKIVELFSDVVMESVLRKIKFLEIRTKSYVQAIQCLSDKMIMVAVNCKDDSHNMSDMNAKISEGTLSDYFQVFKGERKYIGDRERDLFDMTLQGYEVSDGTLFKSLQITLVE